MSAKNARNYSGLIMHCLISCGKIRNVVSQIGQPTDPHSTIIQARFWAKVECKSHTECWPWTAAKSAGGYGLAKDAARRTHCAHRLAYQYATGRDPVGHVVMHRCDNAACCNPDHLQLGTQQQNVHDAIAKGRHRFPDWRKRRAIRNQHGYERMSAA